MSERPAVQRGILVCCGPSATKKLAKSIEEQKSRQQKKSKV